MVNYFLSNSFLENRWRTRNIMQKKIMQVNRFYRKELWLVHLLFVNSNSSFIWDGYICIIIYFSIQRRISFGRFTWFTWKWIWLPRAWWIWWRIEGSSRSKKKYSNSRRGQAWCKRLYLIFNTWLFNCVFNRINI